MPSESPAHRRLEVVHLWVDLVSKVLGAVALIAAGVWTYTNFTVERTHDPTMQVDIHPAVQLLRGEQLLLNVDIILQNIGHVAIQPKYASEGENSNLGLEVSIVEIDAVPGEEQGTPDLPEELPWFDWTEGDGAPKAVFHKRNLLATNEDFRTQRYQLNPGVKYREPFACLVEKDKLYAVRARFWTENGSIADLVYVHTFTPDSSPLESANLLRPGLR
jgi:hypothetical protein